MLANTTMIKVTISNKKCDSKPVNKGKFFGGKNSPDRIKFKTGIFSISTFENIVSEDYVLSYQCRNDDAMNRKSGYVGTQFIVVDVDELDYSMDEMMSIALHKPTIIHTSFSHKTAVKNYKSCYHLIYCFSDTIYGETNFDIALKYVTEGYENIVDERAKDCHRICFTTSSTLDNYQLVNTGVIYDFNTIMSSQDNVYEDDLATFFDYEEKTNEVVSETPTRHDDFKSDSGFDLDKDFVHEMFTKERGEFLNRNARTYPYVCETMVPQELFHNGYADLRNINYYKVPSSQYVWSHIENKPVVMKVVVGHRDTMLWLDGHAFCQIIDDISNEYLVYLLMKEVYEHYDNSDRQMTNHLIIKKAKQVMTEYKCGKVPNITIKRSFKLDILYWHIHNVYDVMEMTRLVMKQMKNNDFGQLYDFNKTVEENIKEFALYGIKTKKKTLINWLEDNGLEYITDKEYRNNLILSLYDEDNTRSIRNIIKVLKDNYNIMVAKNTVRKVIAVRQ